MRRVNVQAANADALADVQTHIVELLRQRHRAGSGEDDDFKVQNQTEIGEVATQTTRTMTLLLAGIASVSLVVGGIGIMNIMLVSVSERTQEIGVRMAVGARGRDILRQFLVEALTLSCLGGVIGIGVGTGTSKAISAAQDWPTLVSPESVLVAFLFSAAIGFSSVIILPARRRCSIPLMRCGSSDIVPGPLLPGFRRKAPHLAFRKLAARL